MEGLVSPTLVFILEGHAAMPSTPSLVTCMGDPDSLEWLASWMAARATSLQISSQGLLDYVYHSKTEFSLHLPSINLNPIV